MAKSILSNNPGQLVTKAKVNVSDWTSYTPTTQGLGTVSNVDFKWRRVGDTLEVVGQLTSGTVTADEMQISLPDNLIISSKTTRFVGEWYREISQNTVYFHNVLATAGDSFVNFSLNSAINDGIGDDLANAVVPNSTNLFFKWRVPIAGWDSQAEFLAAVSLNQWQHKYMSSSNNYADMSFSGLVVGRVYKYTADLYMSGGNTATGSYTLTHNGVTLVSRGIEYVNTTGWNEKEHRSFSIIFKAEASTVTFSGSPSGFTFVGNGTGSGQSCYAMIEELNYHAPETTRFT